MIFPPPPLQDLRRRRPLRLALSLALFVVLTLALSPPLQDLRHAVLAQTPTTNIIVALAPLDRESPVELVALTLDVNVIDADGRTRVQGDTTFKLHNGDNANPVTIPVGFPEWAGGANGFDPNLLADFRVTLDNKKIALARTPAPVKIGREERNVNWYAFDLKFDPDEKKSVRVEFIQDLGAGILPRFYYGLLPSNGWKGPIGSLRLTVHFPTSTTGEQFIALDPKLPTFDGQDITWLEVGHNPNSDRAVTFIRPSLWNELLAKRATAAQNADDANAHFALGQVYQQLASVETTRRDNFRAQAIAEFEIAARLDAKHADAALTLAQYYESRAGPAAGTRDPSYVMLAMTQWQNLIGTHADADARKNLAEDSFYLGLGARARGENESALGYFEDAARFAPQGAGPLYTRARWQREVQAAHVALAQALAQEDKIAAALTHARAAFGNNFDLAPIPPLPVFALSHAIVTTTSAERRIVLRLLPYPSVSNEARQALAASVVALNQTGAAAVTLSESESDYTLTLSVPFNSDRDLQNRLSQLARAIPNRVDWLLTRAVIAPAAFEWSEPRETFTQKAHYREQLNLDAAWAQSQQGLDVLETTIDTLEKAPATDLRSQLRAAFLDNALAWWQRALAAATVTYDLQPTFAPARQWTVRPDAPRTLTYDSDVIRAEWYVIGAGSGAIVFLLALLAWSLRRGRRNRRAPRKS